MHKYFVLFLCVSCIELKAQKNQTIDSVSFYGWFREHLAIYDGNIQLQDNSPRIGTKLTRKFSNNWYAKAQLEYGIHIVQGVNFNKDANTAQELIANPFVNSNPLTSRLANIELGNDKWGSLVIGKQWSAFYDVAFYTDRFNLFGGSANAIYSGGTDGGWSGTGRADKAIIYRNKFGNWNIGLHTQLNGKSANFGLAAQYYLNKNLTIGAAYNNAKISTTAQYLINNLGPNVNNLILGLKYSNGKYYIGFTSSINNSDIIVLDNSTILALPTYGNELSISYFANNKWSFDAGFNQATAQKYNPFIGGNYRLLHLITAANYFLSPKTRIYCTYRLSNSKFVNNLDNLNVFALGFRYDFEYSIFH